MTKQHLLSLLILAGAIAAPIVYFKVFNPHRTGVQPVVGDGKPRDSAGLAPDGNVAGPVTTSISGPAGGTASASSVPVLSLGSVFNFAATPEWIISRWPRVSTGLAMLQLQGYRVPLVTGTAQTDLAGALTYYFNAQQKVERITFTGTTGDPRALIGLMTSQFRMTRRLTNDPGMIVYEAVRPNNQPASGLRIRSAPIVQASDPYKRFDVELSLERPE